MKGGSVLSANFAHLMKKYGAFDPIERISPAELEAYSDRLPESLLDLWAECGRGAWLGGRFQFCDPARYNPILNLVFRNDADFNSRDCLPYGFTAFGEMLVWSQEHQVIKIDFRVGWITARDKEKRPPDDLIIGISTLPMLDGSAGDMVDDNNRPLFERAVEKLGALSLGEIYGFVPALAVGGSASLDNLQRVNALEHFSVLAQSNGFVLRDFSSWPPRTIRNIG